MVEGNRIDGMEELIQGLGESRDWRERRTCAFLLGRHRGDRVFRALAGAVRDRDPEVRHASIQSLADLGDTRAIELVTRPRILEDSCTNVRWAAVGLIGRLGNLSLIGALSKALQDPEWVVRNQAHLAVADFIRRLDFEVDREQIKALIRLLVIPDPEVKELVEEALARRSTRALDLMVAAMDSHSVPVRSGVARALGMSLDPRALPALGAATRDSAAPVRLQAAIGLGQMDHRGGVEALVGILGDPDRSVCEAASAALVRIGEPAVHALLSSLAHANSKRHRRYIIVTLGELRPPQGILPLVDRLRSSYYVVRSAAVNALSAYGDPAIPALIKLVQVNDLSLGPLLEEAADQENIRLRVRAIKALGELKNSEAIEPLKGMLHDPEREVREAAQAALSRIELAAWGRHGAVIALGNIGNIKAVPTLIRALRDPFAEVRSAAVMSLARLGHDTAVQPLIVVLENDRDALVRRNAAMALWMLGAQEAGVSKALRYALGDIDWRVRAEAARALGRIDDQKSLRSLLRSLGDASFTVSGAARMALANLGNLAVPILLEAAAGEDAPCRDGALEALWQILDESCREEIELLVDAAPGQRETLVDRIRDKLAASEASDS